MKNLLFLVSLFLILSLQVFSQVTIHVPADYTTIQAAINAANSGDIVLVAEGTYYENINFMGKAITVASHFYLDQKEKHIRKTIINGSQPVDPDYGSVVTFASGEDTNSVLCGFTITGGTGTLNINPGFPPIRRGGGIFFGASGGKIIHNIVVNNKVENEVWCFGGGLSSGPPFIPTFIILEENVFRDNECNGFDMVSGGGAALGSSGRIINNVFEKNIIFSLGGSASGGGLDISSFPELPNEVFVKGNIITHNKALQQEGATYWLGGCGGGMSIILTKGIIENNIIQHNEVSAVNSSFSSGILFDFPPDEVYFRNNIVSHNTFSGAGACYGGGFAIWDGNPTIENNLFEKNDATLGGGGWIGDAFSFAKIINNTIIKNHADMKGGALYAKSAAPTVMNSILWNNHAPEGSEIYVESGTIDVTYSDVMGGWTGTGNINANPKLISLFSLLNHNSPCIDGGNPDPMYNDPESSIFPGYAKFPSRGMLRNDMGAFGGPHSEGWWNFFNFCKEMQSAEFTEEEIVGSATPGNINFNQYPNPFNPSTKITYTLPEAANVSLQVFDILGNEVATLVNESQQPGAYDVEFNARGFASGMYLCRIQIIPANGAGQGFVETKKMILLK